MNKNIDKLIERAKQILEFGKEGTARDKEVRNAASNIKTFLDNNILDLDSSFGRKYDKWRSNTIWWDKTFGVFSTPTNLQHLQSHLDWLLLYSQEEGLTHATQAYIKKGMNYDGRKLIRKILSAAESEVAIQDAYLKVDLFGLLEPYLLQTPNLKVILITSLQTSRDFRSDLSTFIKQYPQVECKIMEESHGRFLYIDRNTVYSLGHSITDIGNKADVISKLESEARNDALNDLVKWWSEGQPLK